MASLEILISSEHQHAWATTGPLIEDPRKLEALQLISINYEGNTHIAMMRSKPDPFEADEDTSYRIEAITLVTITNRGEVMMKPEPTRALMKTLPQYGNLSSVRDHLWDTRQIRIFDDAASSSEIHSLDEIDYAGAWGLYQNVANLFWEESTGAQKLTSLNMQEGHLGFSQAILREVQTDKLLAIIKSCDPKHWDDVLVSLSFIYSLCERPGKLWMSLAQNKNELNKKITNVKQCIETILEAIQISKHHEKRSTFRI